jgi:hypothetical protein
VAAIAASTLRRRQESSVMFTHVEVEAGPDPDRLVVAMARYRPGTSRRQVASLLEAVWVTELRLPGFDAFHFVTEDGYVELESITGDHQSGYYLTHNLIAVEGSDQDFAGAQAPSQPPVEAQAPRGRRRFWKASSSETDTD